MTIQKSSTPAAEGAAELLDRNLAEYADLLRQGALSAADVEAIDFALRHSVVRLLGRPRTSAELGDAYDALRRMVPADREADLAEWKRRWRAFADLVDAKLAALAARQPGRAAALAHAERILELVAAEPGLTQVELGERLQLKPANVTRILAALEADELIERRRVGREKRVHPGSAVPATSTVPDEPEAAQSPRMASYLWRSDPATFSDPGAETALRTM